MCFTFLCSIKQECLIKCWPCLLSVKVIYNYKYTHFSVGWKAVLVTKQHQPTGVDRSHCTFPSPSGFPMGEKNNHATNSTNQESYKYHIYVIYRYISIWYPWYSMIGYIDLDLYIYIYIYIQQIKDIPYVHVFFSLSCLMTFGLA